MASTHLSRTTHGHIFAKINYKDEQYESVKLSLLDRLVSDVILGLDFISQHEKLMIPFEGKRNTLQVCTLEAARVKAPRLFANLAPDCTPLPLNLKNIQSPTPNSFILKSIDFYRTKLLSLPRPLGEPK